MGTIYDVLVYQKYFKMQKKFVQLENVPNKNGRNFVKLFFIKIF